MGLHYSVDDRDVGTRNLVHSNISGMVAFAWRIGEEQEVATVERGLHGTTATESALATFLRSSPRT